MNALLTTTISEEDQQSFNNLAVGFVAKELADCLYECEYPYKADPSTILCKIIDLGFFSVNLPAEYGGLGLSFQPLAGILEHISLIDAGVAGAVFANAAALEIISVASSTTSCEKIYDIIGKTDALPLAFPAYSSPAETSAPAAAHKDGNYTLSGRTDLVVSGGMASYAVLHAVTGDGSYSYFLVNLAEPEIKKSKPVVTIGMQSCMPVDIDLNGARGILIGKEGEGKSLFEEVSRRMSYLVCGMLLGIIKGSFNMAMEYCEERYQGGRMIIDWSDMRMKLAGMGTLISMAETCVCGLKNMFASGIVEAGTYALAAAIHIGNISATVTSEGVQALGGNGYMKDYGQEKRMRDAKQAQSLLGSSPFRKKRIIDSIINERKDAKN